MYSEPKLATIRNHCDSGTSVRGGAGDRAQQEPGGDHHQLDDGDVLEPHRVGQGQRDVRDQHQRQLPVRQHAAGSDRQHDAAAIPTTRASATGTTPGRDRPEPLGRVQPVLLDVGRVVDQIAARRARGERHHGDRRLPQHGRVAEHARRGRRGRHQHALEPLPRPGRPHQAREDGTHRPVRRRRDSGPVGAAEVVVTRGNDTGGTARGEGLRDREQPSHRLPPRRSEPGTFRRASDPAGALQQQRADDQHGGGGHPEAGGQGVVTGDPQLPDLRHGVRHDAGPDAPDDRAGQAARLGEGGEPGDDQRQDRPGARAAVQPGRGPRRTSCSSINPIRKTETGAYLGTGGRLLYDSRRTR